MVSDSFGRKDLFGKRGMHFFRLQSYAQPAIPKTTKKREGGRDLKRRRDFESNVASILMESIAKVVSSLNK